MEPMVNKGVVLVYGDSMLPRLRDGELVHIDKKTGYHVGEVVVFDVGHFCVHRIVAKIGMKYLMKGDNRLHFDGWYENDSILGAISNERNTTIAYLSYMEGLLRATVGCFWNMKDFHRRLIGFYR